LKYGAGVVVAGAAAATAYYALTPPSPPAPPTPTPTTTEIVTTGPPPTTTAPPPMAISLRGETCSDPNFYLWDKDSKVTPGGLLAEYEHLAGANITLERVDWMAHYEKSRLELQSKSPTYDFFGFDSYVRGSYLPNDWFFDLKELESRTGLEMGWADINPRALEWVEYEGKILGVPSELCEAPLFTLRRSLFEDPKLGDEFEKKYGRPLAPPNSWEEVNELAQFFTRKINGVQWYGISLMMAPEAASDEFYFRWLTMGGGKGGKPTSGLIVDEKFQPLINNDMGVKALELMVEVFKKKWCAPGGTEVSWVDITSNYFAGDVAVGYMWSVAWSGVDDPAVSKAAGDIVWHPLPLARDGTYMHAGWPIAVNKFGRYPEETYKFLHWMFAPEQDKRLALLGNNPMRLSTYRDPEVMAMPMNQALYRMATGPSVVTCDMSEFAEMNYEFSLEIQNAALGKKSAKQALDDTAEKWREIMKKAGRYG